MTTILPSHYAGDVTVTDAWEALEKDPRAQLVDVRTAAEWTFVGGPDLRALNRPVHRIEWAGFPSMNPNENFLTEVRAALGSEQDIAVYSSG